MDQTPLVQPTMITEPEIFKYALAQLGHPFINVEITPEQMKEFLSHALTVYSRKIPKIRWFSLPAYAGVQSYTLPRDTIGYGIINVMIPRLDPIAPLLLSSGPRLDIFGYRYSYPYRDISELFIDYWYFAEATRILSSEFDWEWMDGKLRIHPKPDTPFTLTYASAFPRDIHSFPIDDVDWLKTYILAQTKIAVGSVRRKFQIPGAQSGQPLDGIALVDEGREELRLAEQDLDARTPPFPIQRT
jgi:hypothetical protein